MSVKKGASTRLYKKTGAGPKGKTRSLTLRLTEDAHEIIAVEQSDQGITRTTVVELALRHYAKRKR